MNIRTLLGSGWMSLLAFAPATALDDGARFVDEALQTYNVVWNAPSEDSSESMPCGGGDIGLNVWVEDGDVLLYIQRSGSLAENNEYLKLGRVRLRLDPNPFATPEAKFHQELLLRDGSIEIRGTATETLEAIVRIWVEVHRPVIHLEVEASEAIHVRASYENWRLEDEVIPHDGRRRSFFTLDKYPGEVELGKDTVLHDEQGVLFYHRNPNDPLLPGLLIRQQGLEEFEDEIFDDLRGRTFGGVLTGAGFEAAGQEDGVYQITPFRAWHLSSKEAARDHHLRVVTHIAQTEELDTWRQALQVSIDQSANDRDEAREATLAWWADFWDRSWIATQPDQPDPSSRVWRVARNYNLFRYQLGCNAGLLTYAESFLQPRSLEMQAEVGAGEAHVAL